MIFGDLVVLKLLDICLAGEEEPRKKPHPGNLSRPGIEPGPAATACSTAGGLNFLINCQNVITFLVCIPDFEIRGYAKFKFS